MGAEDKVGAMQINARLCGVSLPVTRRLMITEQAFGRFRYPSARKPYFYINLALGPVMIRILNAPRISDRVPTNNGLWTDARQNSTQIFPKCFPDFSYLNASASSSKPKERSITGRNPIVSMAQTNSCC
jgi:hypothetical protein